MGKERERTRIKSRVDELPEDMRLLLDARLADVRITYQEIAEEITGKGYQISKSAVGRYAMRNGAACRRIKEAQEKAKALLTFIRENRDLESTELGMAMLMDGLTRRFSSASDEDYENMPIDKAGRLMAQIQRTTVYKERYLRDHVKSLRDIERNIMVRVRDGIQSDDPELIAKIEAHVKAAVEEEAAKDAEQ